MNNKKILIVDDDTDLLRGLGVRLKASGYSTIFAADGNSAVNTARAEDPDLIILDLGLPGGDGYIVMEKLKLFPTPIPIIVLSAKDPRANKERAIRAGAKIFFHKSVDNDELLATIRKVLEESQEKQQKGFSEYFY